MYISLNHSACQINCYYPKQHNHKIGCIQTNSIYINKKYHRKQVKTEYFKTLASSHTPWQLHHMTATMCLLVAGYSIKEVNLLSHAFKLKVSLRIPSSLCTTRGNLLRDMQIVTNWNPIQKASTCARYTRSVQ